MDENKPPTPQSKKIDTNEAIRRAWVDMIVSYWHYEPVAKERFKLIENLTAKEFVKQAFMRLSGIERSPIYREQAYSQLKEEYNSLEKFLRLLTEEGKEKFNEIELKEIGLRYRRFLGTGGKERRKTYQNRVAVFLNPIYFDLVEAMVKTGNYKLCPHCLWIFPRGYKYGYPDAKYKPNPDIENNGKWLNKDDAHKKLIPYKPPRGKTWDDLKWCSVECKKRAGRVVHYKKTGK